MRRMSSWSRSKASFLSIIVAPGGGSTPPVMTSPGSPSAWQPTTVMTRWGIMFGPAIRERGSALAERGLETGDVLRPEHDPVVRGDVDEVDVDAGLGDLAGQVGESSRLVLDADHHHLALAGDDGLMGGGEGVLHCFGER